MVGGVKFPSWWPIGIVGLATTTGKPDVAANSATCSAISFECVYGPASRPVWCGWLPTAPVRYAKRRKEWIGRAVQKPRHALFARCGDDDLGAAAIDVVKVAFVRHPHAWQRGKVIDILDTVEGLSHQRRIEYRALNELHACTGQAGGRISRMRTRRPCSRSAVTRCCPMKPLPPVTSVCVTDAGPDPPDRCRRKAEPVRRFTHNRHEIRPETKRDVKLSRRCTSGSSACGLDCRAAPACGLQTSDARRFASPSR